MLCVVCSCVFMCVRVCSCVCVPQKVFLQCYFQKYTELCQHYEHYGVNIMGCVFVSCVCVCVCVCVVCVFVCVCVWHVFCKGRCVCVRVCVCVDLFAVHKLARHAGTACCIFENSTVKNYFVVNNTLCQSLDFFNHFCGIEKMKTNSKDQRIGIRCFLPIFWCVFVCVCVCVSMYIWCACVVCLYVCECVSGAQCVVCIL